MMFPSREQVERLRKRYPPGTRVELTAPMQDPYAPLQPGARGTCLFVDDAGDLSMLWDCGSTLNLLPDIDSFRIVLDEDDA